MIHELNELKWLVLPLYPLLVLILGGMWLARKLSSADHFNINLRMFGMEVNLSAGESTCQGNCNSQGV